MSDIVRPCCWTLCPKVLSPRNTKILSGFWRAMLGQIQGWKQHFGPILGPDWGQVWPPWALLRYLEATAILLGQSWVVFKLSWAILFGHVVALLHPEMLSPSRTKILNGFLRAMLAPFGVKVRLSDGHVGAILGPISAILGLC